MGTNRPAHILSTWLFAFVILMTCATAASAGNTYWQHDPATPGDWFDPANWTNGVPGTERAYIDNGGTGQIFSGDAQALNLILGFTDAGGVSQTGGTNNIVGSLMLGLCDGSSGAYELTGAGYLSADSQQVGFMGTGFFDQSGGVNSVATKLYLGYGSGSSGTYQLSGTGQLLAQEIYVGPGGTGVFNQSGGTNTVSVALNLGENLTSNGTYNLSGGHLSAGTINILEKGTLNWTGGTLDAGKITVGTGGLMTVGQDWNPGNALDISGGTVDLGAHQLTVDSPSAAAATLSSGSLTSGSQYIGCSGTGTMTQTSGTNTVSGDLYLGHNAGSNGTYNLSYGALSVDTAYVGHSGTGSITHTGGTNTVSGDLYLGYNAGSNGTYNLSGDGSLSVTRTAYVGYSGMGSMTQSGGTARLKLKLGPTGVYNLIDGELYCHYAYVLDGGRLCQTGGVADFGYTYVTNGGVVEVEGGSLSSERLYCYGNPNVAQFHQSGGTVEFEELLCLGGQSDSVGTYGLSGTGSLVTGMVYVGYDGGSGLFRQTGGTHTTGVLNIGKVPSGYDAGYELVGGLLSAESVDVLTANKFRQSGGDCAIETLQIRTSASYEFTGGTWQVGWFDLQGEFDLGEADVTVHSNQGSWLDFSAGTISNASNASLTSAPQSVVVFSQDQDPESIFGSVDLQGILHRLGQTLVIPADNTIIGPEIIYDRVDCVGSLLHRDGHDLNLRNGLILHDGGHVDLGINSQLSVKDQVSGMGNSTLIGMSLCVMEGGHFTQTGGTADIYVHAGALATSGQYNPGTYELRDGLLECSGGGVGLGYEGEFIHSGGEARGWVHVDPGGTYRLSGAGVRRAPYITLDYRESYPNSGVPDAAACFVQTGGLCEVSDRVTVGWWQVRGLPAEYEISAGQLHTRNLNVGWGSPGLFAQDGGTVEVTDVLRITYYSVYELRAGSLAAAQEYIAEGGDYSHQTEAAFIQSGGVHQVGVLRVGSTGRYELVGGQMTVTDSISFADGSQFMSVPGATIHMTGSAFENESTDPEALAGLKNLTLIFEGGTTDIDPFEVAGEDMGAIFAGFDSNFALGTLQLGGADIGQLQLVDLFDNRPDWEGNEALYVENLILGAGSTLDLNGLNLYYINFTDLGGTIDLNGGSMAQVPEPATLSLLAVGAVALLRRKRR